MCSETAAPVYRSTVEILHTKKIRVLQFRVLLFHFLLYGVSVSGPVISCPLFSVLPTAGHAEIDRYLLSARPTAQACRSNAVARWDRQTDECPTVA